MRIFLYPAPTILHAKHFTIDDEVGVIGSSNMDMRSFSLDYEISVMVRGRSFVEQLREVEESYRAVSKELTIDEWTARSGRTKVLDNTMRLYRGAAVAHPVAPNGTASGGELAGGFPEIPPGSGVLGLVVGVLGVLSGGGGFGGGVGGGWPNILGGGGGFGGWLGRAWWGLGGLGWRGDLKGNGSWGGVGWGDGGGGWRVSGGGGEILSGRFLGGWGLVSSGCGSAGG